jgi:hypothetical protein
MVDLHLFGSPDRAHAVGLHCPEFLVAGLRTDTVRSWEGYSVDYSGRTCRRHAEELEMTVEADP